MLKLITTALDHYKYGKQIWSCSQSFILKHRVSISYMSGSVLVTEGREMRNHPCHLLALVENTYVKYTVKEIIER